MFPTSIITRYPEAVDFYQFMPVSTRRSAMSGGMLAQPDDRREMRAARYLANRINEATTKEDIQLIEWTWEGVRSSAFEDIHLSDLESGVRDYHDRLRKTLPVLTLPEAPAPGTLARVNQELAE